jgi:hypothetical protein
VNPEPLGGFQNESTLVKYMNEFTRLFCFLIRSVESALEVAFSASEQLRIAELDSLLRSDALAGFPSVFHSLVDSLMEHSDARTIEEPDKSRLMAYLCVSNVKLDGSFQPATNITRPVAMLQWAFKATIFVRLRYQLEYHTVLDSEAAETMIRAECVALHDGRLTPYSDTFHTDDLVALAQHFVCENLKCFVPCPSMLKR